MSQLDQDRGSAQAGLTIVLRGSRPERCEGTIALFILVQIITCNECFDIGPKAVWKIGPGQSVSVLLALGVPKCILRPTRHLGSCLRPCCRRVPNHPGAHG